MRYDDKYFWDLLMDPTFFSEGPHFRYVIRNVSTERLPTFGEKYHTTLLWPTYVALAESFMKWEAITRSHPYFERGNYATTSDEVFNDQVEDRRRLFEDIKANGVLEPVEIVVDGSQIVSFHGFHRLAFAITLGVPSIPVAMLTLDRNLIELAGNLFSIYELGSRIALYQPLNTPYFELCPVHHPEAPAKAEAILRALAEEGVDKMRTIIDFGAHLGYYSRKMRGAGYLGVVSIDQSKRMYEAQRQLNNLGFTVLAYTCMSFEDYMKIVDTPAVLVALSVIHPMIKEGRANLLINQMVDWISKGVDIFIVEHLDEGDTEACSFWMTQCGFTGERVIFHDDARGRTTHLFTRR